MISASLVADVLEHSGLGKSELSRRSGVSRSLLDAYLKGAKQPTLRQIGRLAEAAGVHVGYDLQPILETPSALREVLDLTDHLPRHRPDPLPHTSHVWKRRHAHV